MTKNIPPTEAAARSPNPPSNTGQAVRASVGDLPRNSADLNLTFIGDRAFTEAVRREARAQAWSDFCFCLAILAIIAGVAVAVMEVT